MGTATFDPDGSYDQPGWTGGTIFGTVPSGDYHDALNDESNSTGVHFGTTYTPAYHAFVVSWAGAPTGLPAGAHINWARVDYRARHVGAACMMWVYDLRAFGIGTGIPHLKYMAVSDPGSTAAAAGPINHSTPTTATADDGTPWRDCEVFHVVVGRWGPNGTSEFPWDASNYPYMTELELVVGYTLQPVVIGIDPSGITTEPRPTITWGIDDLEETPPTSHHVIVLPPSSVDADSNTIGDPDFDPTTGSGMAFNSGRTFTSGTSHYVDTILVPGVWHAFVRQWVGSGIDEYASEWESDNFTLESLTVDPPAVTLTDHFASYTTQVTIAPGAHTEDLVADTIEVQVYDAEYGWGPAPIADSMVPGTVTSVFHDGTRAPNTSVSYRARGIAEDAGIIYASAWTTGTYVTGDLSQWWMRSVTDHTQNVSLGENDNLMMRSWKPTRQHPQATTWGIGARLATVVHDVTKGDVIESSVWAMNQDAYLAYRRLLEDNDDLVIVSPWSETWRVQPGPQVSEDVVKAAPRPGETTGLGYVRTVDCSFIEVVRP